MLHLPPDWRSITAGATALDLIGQAESPRMSTEIARLLIWATIEMRFMPCPTRARKGLRVESVTNFIWRVEGLFYVFVPEMRPEYLTVCKDLMPTCLDLIVITGRSHDVALRRVLRRMIPNRWISIDTIDTFLSIRIMFASVDHHWSIDKTMRAFLEIYCRLVVESGGDRALLVELPT